MGLKNVLSLNFILVLIFYIYIWLPRINFARLAAVCEGRVQTADNPLIKS